MNQNNLATIPEHVKKLGGKSWVAYVPVIFFGLLLLFIAPYIFVLSNTFGIIFLLGTIAFMVHQILMLRSYELYFDEIGVWAYSGVLPWDKGSMGVKWRDLDEAIYFQSLGSWIFKSYSIRIGHRFTKSNEIILTHWQNGDEAAMTINKELEAMVRNGTLN